jgi:hypothetical protein
MVRDLAEFALHFKDHLDVAELQRRGNALLEAEGSDADLVSLAASFPDGEDADLLTELERSAREVLAQQAPMSRRSQALSGAYLLALGLALIAALPWAWPFSTALADGQAGVRTHFLGLVLTRRLRSARSSSSSSRRNRQVSARWPRTASAVPPAGRRSSPARAAFGRVNTRGILGARLGGNVRPPTALAMNTLQLS